MVTAEPAGAGSFEDSADIGAQHTTQGLVLAAVDAVADID